MVLMTVLAGRAERKETTETQRHREEKGGELKRQWCMVRDGARIPFHLLLSLPLGVSMSLWCYSFVFNA
jgi:hypothetical protein